MRTCCVSLLGSRHSPRYVGWLLVLVTFAGKATEQDEGPRFGRSGRVSFLCKNKPSRDPRGIYKSKHCIVFIIE